MLANLGSLWYRKATVADLLCSILQQLCSCQGQSRLELCVHVYVRPCQTRASAAEYDSAASAGHHACTLCRQSLSVSLCARTLQLAPAHPTQHSRLLVYASAQFLKCGSQTNHGCVQQAALCSGGCTDQLFWRQDLTLLQMCCIQVCVCLQALAVALVQAAVQQRELQACWGMLKRCSKATNAQGSLCSSVKVMTRGYDMSVA